MRRLLFFVVAFASGCGGGQGGASAPANEPAASDPKVSVSTEIRRTSGANATCGDGDVCGYLLQIVSPGSDPKDLADKAIRLIKGKCGGHVIVYKDPRNVMGAGTVLATAEEKRACERALGRGEDKDFPNHVVLRVVK